MRYLLYLFGFYCFIIFVQYLIVFLRLKKSTVQYPAYSLVTREKVPKHFQRVFTTAIGELKALGFEEYEYLQIAPMLKRSSFLDWGVLLLNKDFNSCAVVSIKFFSESVDLFKIHFYTFLEQDRVLLTMNAEKHGLIGNMPGFFVEDSYSVNVASQWQTHQDKLNQLIADGEQLKSLTMPDCITNLVTHSQAYVDYLARQKKLVLEEQGSCFKLELITAIEFTHKLLQGSKKTGEMLAKKRRLAMSNLDIAVDIPPEIEVETFERMEQMQQGLVSKKARIWILLISLIISTCVLSLSQRFDGLYLIIFLSVLAFHELGHVLAMKFFGYRDTSVLFIPFFGALATGTKENATLTQKFWISFAGPLPGLILGIILATVNQGQNYGWQSDASLLLITLNLFNLLPVYPLDGGQIADLLIFSGFPYVGVIFRALGVILLAVLGIVASPLLLLFAVLIALTIPQSLHTAKTNRKIRPQLSQTKSNRKEDILLSIFQSLEYLEYDNLPFAKKYNLAKDLLYRYHESSAKLSTKVFLTVLHLFTLLGGIIGGINTFIPGGVGEVNYLFENPQQTHIRIREERKKIIERATIEINQDPNNLDAYLARANALLNFEEDSKKLADYEQIVRLKPDNLKYRLTRAHLRDEIGKHEAAIEDYDYILAQDNNNTNAYYGKGKALSTLNKNRQAIINYDQIIRLNPQDVSAYYFRAKLFDKVAEFDKAIADYTQIIKLNPQDNWAYVSRGEIQLKLHNYQSALDDANKSISLYAEDYHAYSLSSRAKRFLGDIKGAQADKERAERLYEYY